MTDDALLDVRDLRVSFAQRGHALFRRPPSVRAVDGISFAMRHGRTLGLVGESGSGKSTLARALLRLVPAASGQIRFDGHDLLALDAADMRRTRRHLQVIFQDPFGSLDPQMTVGEIVAEPLRVHGIVSGQDVASRVTELLQSVGLQPEHAQRYPRQFSGGQRQRVAIARALATSPRLIICDEPVSALDVSVQSQIINLLVDLSRSAGLTYLFITHNFAIVRQIADEVAVMYLGRIVEYGPTDAVFENPRHPYTAALLASVPLIDPGARHLPLRVLGGEPPSPASPPPGCRFHPRCLLAEGRCRTDDPRLEIRPGVRSNQLSACHFSDRVAMATPEIRSAPGVKGVERSR